MAMRISTIEWNKGIPTTEGHYLVLGSDGDIDKALLTRVPHGSKESLRWHLRDRDRGWRMCGEAYVVEWAEWPRAYEIKEMEEGAAGKTLEDG